MNKAKPKYWIVAAIMTGLLLEACLPLNNVINPADNSADAASDAARQETAASSDDTYYLFSPINSTDTYLMDAEGQSQYVWHSDYSPGLAVYLLDDGSLLRTGNLHQSNFDAGGSGGIVQIIAPDSSVTWSYQYANDEVQAHHDVEMLPNGDILMIAWEYKSEQEALDAGRDPSLLPDGELWPDHIIEVNPQTNEIVWEWHVWDHLVQDNDAAKPNYGDPASEPGKIDLNYVEGKGSADWTHFNAIDYNADLDQIMVSVHNFSEVWIIDHSISTEEAKGEAGDLLYRWGNPQAYGAGSTDDQQLFHQHDASWIPDGYPGAGDILIFNNGEPNAQPYSSVVELTPPLALDGSYTIETGQAYGPQAPVWTYQSENPQDFYAERISGAQRLMNGDTLICDGTAGRFFEVTPEGEVVWEYNYGGEVFRVTAIGSDQSALSYLNLQAGEKLQGSNGSSGNGENSGNGGKNGMPGAGQANGQLDFEGAAAVLGVSAQEIRQALGSPPPNFAAAAQTLGVSEAELREALGAN